MHRVILRNKNNNRLYSTLDGIRFKDIISGMEKDLDENEIKNYAINLDATSLFNQFPNIERLISSIKLKISV
jgi:DNA-binding transcriptional MerR regulator